MIGKICRVPGCKKIIHAPGTLCPTHRTRWQMHKTFEPGIKSVNRFKPVVQKNGYIRINKNGKRVLEHIWVLEQFLGRKLKKGECSHHINGIKTDNRIENLELMTNKRHQLLHRLNTKYDRINHKFIKNHI